MNRELQHIDEKNLVSLLIEEKGKSDRAFNEIYERYKADVYKYCTYMTDNIDEANDVFQETFIRFYNNIDLKKLGKSVISYLIIIARSICLNLIRNRKSTVEFSETTFSVDERNQYDNNELFELIIRSLDLLKPENREAFILKELQGFKYREIADILDISESSAKTKVARAKVKITKILQPYISELKQ